MKKVNEFFDKIFNVMPGYIFGLIAFTISLSGNILALIFTPEYEMTKNSISALGDLTGGIFLRTGFIISGLIAIPFFIYLGKVLKDKNVNELLRKTAIGAGIFSSICVSLTGTFSGVNEFIKSLHGTFAMFGWFGNIAGFILFSLSMLKNPKFSKSPVYVGFIGGGILGVFLIPFFITNFCNYFRDICYSFGQTVWIIMPTYEWIVYYSILFWILFTSSYMFYNKI
jgi:uncharacterized integral membrane protein